jgi:hypothetical protein
MVSNVKHDPFWDFLDKHNITIGKPQAKTPIYDDINKIERGMTDDEYYEFIKKSGQEIKRRITDEVISKNLPDDDVEKEITNIKTEVRNQFKTELFGWGQLRSEHPNDWKILRDNDALQVPKSSEELKLGKEKMRIGSKNGVPSKELEDLNSAAMETYRGLVLKYLQNTETVSKDKTKFDPQTHKSNYEIKIDDMWRASIATARAKAEKKIMAEKATSKK